jgi:integrase
VALMCYGGLRRAEIVALDMGDVAPGSGLRRVQGKGGVEAAVPLPEVAQRILTNYMASERAGAALAHPLFVSRFKTKGGQVVMGRMKGTASGRLRRRSARGRASRSSLRTRSVTHAGSSCSGGAGGIFGPCRNTSGMLTSRRRRSTRGSRSLTSRR